MNSVLALGGAFGSSSDCPAEAASIKCYVDAIRELKSELTSWSPGCLQGTLRLLLVTLFLAFSEVRQGMKTFLKKIPS